MRQKQIIFLFWDQQKLEQEEKEEERTKETASFMKGKETTVRKTAKDLNVPSKYDNLRKPPQEVPIDVIKKLFLTMDSDLDDRISASEIKKHMKKVKLTLEEGIADALFNEIAERRAVVHEKQKSEPLDFEEIVAAIRGRHKWNTETKTWEHSYRPMREYWIILLKTVSDKVFTLPPPEIKPEKILAQFEINEMMMEQRNQPKLEGSMSKYISIKETKQPLYKRVEDKPEVEIQPDEKGKVKLEIKEKEKPEFNPYEYQINRRIKKEKDDDGQEFPKMSWEARAFFEQSLNISKQNPTWESEEKNPIMYYIPTRQMPEGVDLPASAFVSPEQYPTKTAGYKTHESFNFSEMDKRNRNNNIRAGHRSKKSEKSMPSTPYEIEDQSIKTFSRNPTKSIEKTVNEEEQQSMLYGPKGGLRTFTKSQLVLTEFKKTQISKGTKRTEIAGLQNPQPNYKNYGFRTRFILNDLFTDKVKNAREARNKLVDKKKEVFVPHEFEAYRDPVFRDDDLPFGKKPLDLLYK